MRRTMLTVVPVALGLGLCCVACKPVATASEPTRTTTVAVTTLTPPRDATTPMAPAWLTVCGPVDLPERPLAARDEVIDLAACTERTAPTLLSDDAERERALVVLGQPSTWQEPTGAPITCSNPPDEVSWIARTAADETFRVDEPRTGSHCPVPPPDLAELEAGIAHPTAN